MVDFQIISQTSNWSNPRLSSLPSLVRSSCTSKLPGSGRDSVVQARNCCVTGLGTLAGSFSACPVTSGARVKHCYNCTAMKKDGKDDFGPAPGGFEKWGGPSIDPRRDPIIMRTPQKVHLVFGNPPHTLSNSATVTASCTTFRTLPHCTT